MRQGRRRAVWIIAAVVVVVAAGAGTTAVVLSKGEPALPRAGARAYLDAWQTFDAAAMARYVDRPPADFNATVAGIKDGAGITSAHIASGVVRRKGKDRAEALYTATMDIAGLGRWQYTGSLNFVRTNRIWKIAWAPNALHPGLEPGLRFDRTRQWPERAPILGADGSPLAAVSDVVLVGVEPDRVKDRAQVDAVLKQHLNVDPKDTTAALNAPGVQPSYFVRIAAVRPDQFATVGQCSSPSPASSSSEPRSGCRSLTGSRSTCSGASARSRPDGWPTSKRPTRSATSSAWPGWNWPSNASWRARRRGRSDWWRATRASPSARCSRSPAPPRSRCAPPSTRRSRRPPSRRPPASPSRRASSPSIRPRVTSRPW